MLDFHLRSSHKFLNHATNSANLHTIIIYYHTLQQWIDIDIVMVSGDHTHIIFIPWVVTEVRQFYYHLVQE